MVKKREEMFLERKWTEIKLETWVLWQLRHEKSFGLAEAIEREERGKRRKRWRNRKKQRECHREQS